MRATVLDESPSLSCARRDKKLLESKNLSFTRNCALRKQRSGFKLAARKAAAATRVIAGMSTGPAEHSVSRRYALGRLKDRRVERERAVPRQLCPSRRRRGRQARRGYEAPTAPRTRR